MVALPMTRSQVFSKSVPGTSHEYEDRVLVDESRGLYAVADGVTVSSQGSGGLAAERTVALLKEMFSGDLAGAVQGVHEALLGIKSEDRTIGETTLIAAHVSGDTAEIVNVGDSPAYLLRGHDLRVLTHADRSELEYLTQVIGYPEKITVHRNRVELQGGDYLVLASDGVAHVLNHATLVPMVTAARGPKEVAEAIIEAAREGWTGYDDDKSVIVIRVSE